MQKSEIKYSDKEILDQLPYLNELMVAIRQVNDAILQGKDARDAAENLISDLPIDWYEEIINDVGVLNEKYNTSLKENNVYLKKGTTPQQKLNAKLAIITAEKEYAREVKRIIITLMSKKNLLFKTKKPVEQGYLSLFEGEE